MARIAFDRIQIIACLALYPIYITIGLLRFLGIVPARYIVFGGRWGVKFTDNTKYLFLMLRDEPGVVWVSKDRALVQKMRGDGLPAIHLGSWRGLLACLCAKMVFLSYSTFDVSPVFMFGTPVIQLWHGIGFKRIGFESDGWNSGDFLQSIKNAFRRLLYGVYPHLNYMYCDRLVSLGDSTHMLGAFGIGPDKVWDLGFPRLLAFDDDFWEKHREHLRCTDLDRIAAEKAAGKRIVVYMPTYRKSSTGDHHVERDRFLERIAREPDILLVYKCHHLDAAGVLPDGIVQYTEEDPYPLLRYADALVTDYSSIMIDFLVLDRPVLVFAYDLEFYRHHEAGFNNDFESLVPGAVITVAEDLIERLRKELAHPGMSLDRRRACRDFFALDAFATLGGVRAQAFADLVRTPSRGSVLARDPSVTP